MYIDRAVITAAAPEQATLPLQRLVDQSGRETTALQLILQEVHDAGIENICLVICPGRRESFELAAGGFAQRLTFVEQDRPRGYGDALHRARDFVADRPFLHLVSDHLYLSRSDRRCARQLVDLAKAEECSVSAVQATRESQLPFFGAVGGTRVALRQQLYEVARVLEKPTPTQAEQELVVAGLRSGCYLCLFGMHVLSATIMELLELELQRTPGQKSISLSPALSALGQRERHLALEVNGSRHNIGVRYGLLMAQLALGLSGADRDLILTELVELLAAPVPNR